MIPPYGYTLAKGIGTTYSLDMETLTAICISLGIKDGTDSASSQSSVCMLHSIEEVTGKVVIFCESGQMIVPKNTSPLFLLLEKMIVPVALKTKTHGFYNSFHAKCWILEYENEEGEKIFRFIVMSRNMTSDRSWDVVASFDGKRSNTKSPNANELIGFLEYLKGTQLKKTQTYYKKNKSILDGLIQDLDRVSFECNLWGNGKPFEGMEILPIYDGRSIMDRISAKYHGKVIISPFLSEDVIKQIADSVPYANASEKILLITRATELKKVEKYSDRFDVYIIKEQILNGEVSYNGEPVKVQDIHAKMYLIRQYSWSWLLLGSMNASNGSTGGNVEMMISLSVPNRYLNEELLIYDLFDRANSVGNGEQAEDNNPFEKVEFPLSNDDIPGDIDNDRLLMQAVKDICRCNLSATVLSSGDSFDIILKGGNNNTGYNLYLSPIRRPDLKCSLNDDIQFRCLKLTELSEFYIITAENDISSVSKVIMIPTSNIPEERDKKIVSSIINSRKAFFDYVCYILGDGSIADLLSQYSSDKDSSSSIINTNQSFSSPALFEMMLRAAFDNKNKILELDKIVKTLSEEVEENNPEQKIITDEFKKVYCTFEKALKLKKK